MFAHGVGVAGAPAIVDLEVLTDSPTRLLEALRKCRQASLRFRIVSGETHQHAHPAQRITLLRSPGAGTYRGHRRATEQSHELTPSHAAISGAQRKTWLKDSISVAIRRGRSNRPRIARISHDSCSPTWRGDHGFFSTQSPSRVGGKIVRSSLSRPHGPCTIPGRAGDRFCPRDTHGPLTFAYPTTWLVSVLAGRIDDGCPTIDFTRERGLGSFRRGLVLGHRRGGDLIESLHEVGILQRNLQRAGELLNDGRWRSLGRKQSMPDSELKAAQSGFIGGGKRGERGEPGPCSDRISLHLPALDRASRIGCLVASHVDLLPDEIVHDRAGAAVRHRGELDVQLRCKQHSTKMRGRTDARIPECRLGAGSLE